jgi:hypothetical protein
MADRIPGVLAQTCVRLFARGEAFDSEGFIGFFVDSPMYQFGNGAPCLTKEAIKVSIDGFFGAIDALYHDVRNLWEVGDTVFVEMDVIYWRKDGTSVRLPCSDILRFKGDKIEELRIYMDANPIFVRDMVVGDKASVMTIVEGKQVPSPHYMKKYFAEDPEGIVRVATGLAPKWAIAGPKWPIESKKKLLNDLQTAIATGNSEAVRSYLTDSAILKIGNREEVVGPAAILGALYKLFTDELRPSGANFTAVWEPDQTTLVVEMVVQATRVAGGKAIDYPCVETYRFEGNKVKEWRVYPIEATLLDPQSLVAAG